MNEDRNKIGKFASIFGIISNIFLGIIKLIIGLISKSVSIMADAINNISDTFTSILSLLGFKLANKEPDMEHPYGHARYEYISGFVISILMIETGLILAKESITKIIFPEELKINIVTFAVLIISILIKVIQMMIYLKYAKKINANTLKTTAMDSRNDVIATSAILLSILFVYIFKINIDGYIGLIVSLFVIYSSINTAKDSIEPLIGIIPTKEQVESYKNFLLKYKYVVGIHDMLIHNYGVHNDFVTVHVEIDAETDVMVAHELIDDIEREFKEKFNANLTIHMDPVELNNPEIDRLKKEVQKSLLKLNEQITIHDFRIVEGKKHTNVVFDCVVPFSLNYSQKDIIKHLKQTIKDKSKTYYFVIEIDRPYC